MALTRRSFLGAGALGSAAIFVRSLKAADYTFIQFHNQAVTSSLHHRLVEMWTAIRTETNGRVEAEVFAENRGLAGSDPAALRMLVAGEIQFFTLMGGILANVVPSAEVQQVPFSFRSAAAAHKAMDGALGAYLREEMAAKGIFGFPVGVFDNGMRQIASAKRPIVRPDDLVGVKMRVPDGQIFADTFRALGSVPMTLNVNGIYDGLKSGAVDAQENPLAVVELFKLYEVVRYVSMSNHMWSGFNLMAHLPTWQRLPAGIRTVIEQNAAKYVRTQRLDQETLNAGLRAGLASRGLVFNDVDQGPFRAKLSGLYTTWKGRLGTKCWSLLQASTNVVLALALVLAATGAQAQVQPPVDRRATSPTLEDVPYPYPVSFLPLIVDGRDVRMAYMDVPPAGAANGRTVVLLHGLNFYGEYWAGTIDVLRRSGFRVVVPDQVGFGRSSKVVMPYTFSGMALNTRKLLDTLGIQRAAIVGHSMGGMLATRFALLYPDVTERLVLYNQIGLTDARLARPPTPTDEVYQQVLHLDYAAIYQSIARYFPNGVTPVVQKYITRQYGWTLSGNWPQAAMVRALQQQMVYEDPVVYDWPNMKVKTLEIGGEKDGATPNFPALAKKTCETIPNCQLVLFPNVGHVPHLETPEVFHRELLRFLLM